MKQQIKKSSLFLPLAFRLLPFAMFAYSILYAVALAFLLPFEYFKRPIELRGRWLRERLGLYTGEWFAGRPVWIHAVSVGEVIASVPLLKKIRQRHPSFDIVISTVTDTGQKVATELAGAYAKIVYVPFDLPLAVRNAMHRIRPSVFMIMETELWPNIIRTLGGSRVPVVLMNGRLSERSHKRYKKLGFFIGGVLRDISLICVQDELYAARFRSLGAAPEQIKVAGNFKFDTRPSSSVPEWTEALCGPVIIAGSTHDTEEELVLDAYTRLKPNFPSLNLIIAPRHPDRFKAVEEMIKKRGLRYLKRSEMKNSAEARKAGSAEAKGSEKDKDFLHLTSELPNFRASALGSVILLDVMGELSAVYGVADIAVMGGSFIEHGGQNPLEPAAWGKAVVCGPHMENFPFIADFYKSGGAVGTEAPLLYGVLKGLLQEPERARRIGSMAKELCEKNEGATERAMELIDKYLKGYDPL